MRRPAIVAALAVAAAAAVTALAVTFVGGRPTPVAPPPAAVSLAASFQPAGVQFGDASNAVVTVLLDRDAVRPGTLRLSDDLAPLTQLGPARTARTVRGRIESVTVQVPVACLSDACAAHAGSTTIALPRVRAFVRSRSDRADVVTAAWPRLRVGSRVAAADLAARQPPFVVDLSPAAPRFRLPPGPLALALDAVAAAAAAGSVLLLGLQLAALRRRRRPEEGELARALRLAREAESRPTADRRRALGLLGRLLDARDHVLGGAADELAWSAPAPDDERLHGLLERIERRRRS